VSGPEISSAEALWGFQRGLRVTTAAKWYALIAGLSYVVLGLAGWFYTGGGSFTEMSGKLMFGYFGMTPYHNVVHLAIGGLWLLAALVLTPPAAQGINLAIGGTFVLVAVLGYFGFLHFLGIHDGASPDNILHIVTGVVTLAFAGLIPTGRRAGSRRGAERA
jgi:hypothetical protein